MNRPNPRIAAVACIVIRQYVNIKDSPASTRREDATVPKYMFFAAYSRRIR